MVMLSHFGPSAACVRAEPSIHCEILAETNYSKGFSQAFLLTASLPAENRDLLHLFAWTGPPT